MAHAQLSIAEALNALCVALVLIASFGMVATRQIQGVVRLFVIQSLLVAMSALLLGYDHQVFDLYALGIITILAKVIAIPWVLRRALPRDIYIRREIDQVLNIPSSLLLALALAIAAEIVVSPLASASVEVDVRMNLPIGLACLLIGAYSLIARREAVPQLIGILAMENGAFLAGIAIASELPLIAEIAVAIDVILIALIGGLLTWNINQTMGTTEAASMSELKETILPWH